MRKILLTLLTTLLCSVTAWADVTLFTCSFDTLSEGSITSGSTTFTAGGKTLTATAKSGQTISWGGSDYLNFNEQNDNNYTHCVRIPITGVNSQTITITITHEYSKKASYKYGVKKTDGTSVIDQTSQAAASNGADVVITIPTLTSGVSDFYVYIGRNSSSYTKLQSITITTPSPSCTSITPTLSYEETTLAIDGSSSAPTVTGNTGSGAVTYSITASSPSGCATVNSSGVVTGVHAGTATVTATVAANGDYCSGTATADFTISCNSITPTFSTDYTSTTLTVGGSTSSTPVIYKDGSSGAISWTSSAPSKATVNSSGVVTPVAAGSATITATVAENGDYCEGSVSKNFTINAAACSPSISASPSSANYCKDDVATALSFTGSGHNAQKWQRSTDGGSSWSDIDGATNATYTPPTSATGSTQYRVVTTCDSYTTTATSSAATVTVKTSPGLNISLAP